MTGTGTITIEELVEARVFIDRSDPGRCVLQLTTGAGEQYIDMAITEMLALGKRLVEDAELLGANLPSGSSFLAN